jgi:hypothetical protein
MPRSIPEFMADQKTKDRRKAKAETHIRMALSKGYKLGDISDVERILEESAKEDDRSLDYYKVLSDRDLGDLFIKVIRENTEPTGRSRTDSGYGTEQNSLNAEGAQETEGHEEGGKEQAAFPTYAESVSGSDH